MFSVPSPWWPALKNPVFVQLEFAPLTVAVLLSAESKTEMIPSREVMVPPLVIPMMPTPLLPT
jgi:hypothetical protein